MTYTLDPYEPTHDDDQILVDNAPVAHVKADGLTKAEVELLHNAMASTFSLIASHVKARGGTSMSFHVSVTSDLNNPHNFAVAIDTPDQSQTRDYNATNWGKLRA